MVYKVGDYWFYFNENGYRVDGRFKLGSYYYYTDPKTGAVKNDKHGRYFYNAKGRMVKNAWVKTKKGYYYYTNSAGRIKYGSVEVNGKTYYVKMNTGKVTTKWYKQHYYDSNGVMAKSCWIGDTYVNKYGNIIKGVKNPTNPSSSDVRLLAALVYYEAGNQSYYGKQCVASVVLNRMKSSKFPNTLRGVIYQSGQFSPAMNGCVDYLYSSGKSIQAQCVLAARTVLLEGSKLKGYYFFNNAYGEKKIGDHYFSKVYR